VILGLLPLRSFRHAEFLRNEVPGMEVPEEVVERMRSAGSAGSSAGIAIAQELLRAVRERVQGVYFIPPFERYDVVAEILDGVADILHPAGSP
jgi:homocysteine S-methyltransferase